MNFLDLLFRFFLAFSHATIIIPILLIGYIWLDRKNFFNGICLLLVSMLFNVALKITFQTPLSPALGKQGFAFPSGHMQSSIVLYGWLFIFFKRPLFRVLFITLLVGIGAGLIHFGYHTFFDVLGAIFFGSLLISTYYLLLRSKLRKNLKMIIIWGFATLLVSYISYSTKISDWSWMAYYTLTGMIISELYFRSKNIVLNSIQIKIIATILFAIFFLCVHKLFSMFVLPAYLFQTKWFLVGLYLPFSLYLSNRLSLNLKKKEVYV